MALPHNAYYYCALLPKIHDTDFELTHRVPPSVWGTLQMDADVWARCRANGHILNREERESRPADHALST